ncbi:MAG: nucleotidyltransferase domain-containing protein [Candidatus Pacearchaeota archaeon]|jgi:predicted nucleotidyltransferase
MYINKNKELKVISLFRRNYNSRFYLRQISKLSKLPLKTCQNILHELETSKILKSKTEGKNKYFFLNLEIIKTKLILQQAEIYQTDLFMEKYPQFKIFLKSIKAHALIIIFGSFAKFTANKNSDLDLLIVSNKKVELPFHLLSFKPHEINLTEEIFLKSIKEQENLIKEIEENHIILNNHSFYVNAIWENYAK